MAKSLNFKEYKAEYQRSKELTQDIIILTLKWEDINMDFVVGFTCKRRKNDSIRVIVDRFTKYDHFILVKSIYSVKELSHPGIAP